MAESTSLPVVAVLGVGPGLGAALAHRFAQKYPVAINAQRAAYLQSLRCQAALSRPSGLPYQSLR